MCVSARNRELHHLSVPSWNPPTPGAGSGSVGRSRPDRAASTPGPLPDHPWTLDFDRGGSMLDLRIPSVASRLIGLSCFAIPAVLPGCSSHSPGTFPDAAPPPADAAVLRCDDSMKTAFKPDPDTTVVLVHA